MGLIDDLNEGAADLFHGDSDHEEAQPEQTREAELAFRVDDVLSKPFINQIARMGSLTAVVQGNWDALQSYIAAGMNDDDVVYDLTSITMSEALVLSLGLNLVGFFIPEMSDVADRLSAKALAAAEGAGMSDETRERLADIQREVEGQKLAEALGFESVEAFKEALGDPDQLFTIQGDEQPPGVFMSVPRDEPDED